MRILIFSPVLPYPPSSGFTIRVYQFLRLLGQRHSVSLLAYAGPDEAENAQKVAALSAVCDAVHTVPAPRSGRGKRLAQLASMCSRRSYQGNHLYTDAMQRKLDELGAGQGFDIIQIETSQLGVFRSNSRAATVLIEHDVVYELLQRIARTERSLFRRAYNWSEYRKLKGEEQAVWKRMSACVVTSEREVPIVRDSGVTRPVVAVPNAVDVEYFQPSDEAVDDNAIVMTGFMRTRPNADAAIYAVREILPHILRQRPEMVLYLVGGDPPDEVTQLQGPNVVVTGSVPDVRPFVRRAAVCVVPLRMGGGTRLKVLEGLAMKKPMVTTSVGCEGLDVEHGQHLLIEDDPAAFADAVLRLVEDRALGATLTAAGYELVHQRYRWEAAVARLEQLYQQLAQTATTTAGPPPRTVPAS